MEVSTEQIPQPETTDPSNEEEMAPDHQTPASPLANTNGASEPLHKFSVEEVRGVLQLVASTGKFWNEWDELKSMLSFQLKQVISEYPEAKIDDDTVNPTLGETYQDLVKRLDEDALLMHKHSKRLGSGQPLRTYYRIETKTKDKSETLHDFPEGPPFTLQRLCEILLDARGIYPVLSKLALALEKNLLVTSTLSKCTESHPLPVVEQQAGAPKEEENTKPHLNSMENGMEPSVEDRDEVMTEVEETEPQDDMTVDTENFGATVSSADNISEPSHDSLSSA